MPGWLSNGMTTIVPVTVNSTASVFPQGTYTNLSARSALIPADTEASTGQSPQSVAATPFQIAACAMALIQNTATSTVHAATLNTVSGLLYTEALTTAAGSDYTFTHTNSLFAATSTPQVQVHSGTNSAGDFQVKSVTAASGSAVYVITNSGTAAWNGTICLGFHL